MHVLAKNENAQASGSRKTSFSEASTIQIAQNRFRQNRKPANLGKHFSASPGKRKFSKNELGKIRKGRKLVPVSSQKLKTSKIDLDNVWKSRKQFSTSRENENLQKSIWAKSKKVESWFRQIQKTKISQSRYGQHLDI